MFQPINLAVDRNGKFFVTDFGDNTVKIFNSTDLTDPINSLGGFNFNEKTFSFPDVLIKPEGEEGSYTDKLFVSDTFNHVIKVYDVASLELVATLGGFGSGDEQFNQPGGLALNADGSELHVVDMMNHRISVWSTTTFAHVTNYGSLGHGEDSGLYFPTDILHVGAGVMYVTDCGHNRIVSFDSDKTESVTYVIKTLDSYVGHEFDELGVLSLTTRTFPVLSLETDGTNFYLSDLYTSNVVKFDASWEEVTPPVAKYGDGLGEVKFAKGMLVVGTDLYVADSNTGEIEVVSLL